jgi:hypothetical protein
MPQQLLYLDDDAMHRDIRVVVERYACDFAEDWAAGRFPLTCNMTPAVRNASDDLLGIFDFTDKFGDEPLLLGNVWVRLLILITS